MPAHPRRADDLAGEGRHARAAVLPHARRRADRLGLRDRDGLHSRDRRRGASLAIKAGKNNRTPVFVDLEKLAAAKGKDRIKFLKEEADRGQLSASVAKAVEAAKTVGGAGRRARCRSSTSAARRRSTRSPPARRSCSRPTSAAAPAATTRRGASPSRSCAHALEPAFERLGPNATPEQILDLKVCDPAMGSGAFLVEACRALAARLVEAWARHPGEEAGHSGGRGRGAARPPPGRAALPLRRRQEPARHRSRQAVAVARDARARPRVHLPRSRAEIGRQPGGADAGADRGGALGHVEARPAAVPATGEGPRRRGDEGPRRNPGRARRHRARHSGGSGIARWKRG